MRVSLLAATILLSPAPRAEAPKNQMSCKAVFRSLDAKNDTVEKTADLRPTVSLQYLVKQEADLESRHFALTEEIPSGDLFAQITQAPDFTKGAVVRGTADSLGRFTATEVVGFTVYRLECNRAAN